MQSDDSDGSFLRLVAKAPALEPAAQPRRRRAVGDVVAERFDLLEELGEGGFGVVFRARDRLLEIDVAVKFLSATDSRALVLFKNEFRTLTRLAHPNLVRLHELFADDEGWFFSMELLHGTDALTWARERVREGAVPYDEERVRALLAGLVDALCFLHRTGRVHRDVKPSNVRVEPDGRVVLLDFGLARGIDDGFDWATAAGTPRYMAPEQAAGERAGFAADWFSVGVVLHEVLAGREHASDAAPDDVRALLARLLDRDPALRPRDDELLAFAGPKRAVERDDAAQTPFVGRSEHLRALHAAFDGAARALSIATIHGVSGMGKSELLARFLEEIRERRPEAIVLEARCLDQESVPFKAIDPIVDDVAQRLLGEGAHASLAPLAPLAPESAAALVQVFPVLGILPAIAQAALDTMTTRGDGVAPLVRERAFLALGELLRAVSRRGPVIVAIDDLQWGDADSGALIASLVASVARAPILFVLSYRRDEVERTPWLAHLLATLASAGVDVHDVAVDALAQGEADALARAILALHGRDRAVDEGRWSTAYAESGGVPFFLSEIVHASVGGEAAHLASLLSARVDRLSSGSRRLIETLAVSAAATDRRIAVQAAQLDGDDPTVVQELVRARLVRVRGGRAIELFHDRVRDAVNVNISADARRSVHLRLAHALASTGVADDEVLAAHYRGGGDEPRAIEHQIRAAEVARRALGFERAIALYEDLVARLPAGDARRGAILTQCAEALGCGARHVDAARLYADAAALETDAARALRMRLERTEHLLVSGRFAEGLAEARAVLAALDIRFPRSKLELLVRTAKLTRELERRDDAFVIRDAIDQAAALRVDACAALALTFTFAEPLVAFYFRKQSIVGALDLGEPARIIAALALEFGLSSSRDGELAPRIRRAHARAAELLPLAPQSRLFYEMGVGMTLLGHGRYAEALPRFANVDRLLTGESARDVRLAAVARSWHTVLHVFLGRYRDVPRVVEEQLRAARARRDDLSLELIGGLCGHVPALIDDAPERASTGEGLEGAGSISAPTRYRASIEIALYRDEAIDDAAVGGSGAFAATFLRSPLLWTQRFFRAEWLFARGRALVAASATRRSPSGRLRARAEGRAVARALATTGTPPGAAYATLLDALLSSGESCVERLVEAERRFDAISMRALAAAARRRRGEILAGDEGAALVTSADRALADEGVRHPRRFARMLAP
ncbi:MAG: protein kinase [Labilithrix sp.]|nr:protein kinase [Labilithrix sp.]